MPSTGVRGAALSSAILYLAIVAIWAVVLVPRWVRRPHASQTLESNLAEPTDAAGHTDLAWAEEGEDGSASTGRADGSGGSDGAGCPAAAAGPLPAERRTRMLRARRGTLLTLIVLTAGAVAIAVAHLAAAWVIIPPAAMLAIFVRLLRESARIDTERARAAAVRQRPRAVAPAQAGAGTAAGDTGTQQAGSVDHTQAVEPDAEVIDISARVGDQLYDQYADAEVRAVGD
jgi:hypothetical protein